MRCSSPLFVGCCCVCSLFVVRCCVLLNGIFCVLRLSCVGCSLVLCVVVARRFVYMSCSIGVVDCLVSWRLLFVVVRCCCLLLCVETGW